MIRLWLNPILITSLILLAAASTFGLTQDWTAFAVGLAAAAFIANATLAIAKAVTQRGVFANSMWAIAHMCMLGLLLSGSLNQKAISFDEEIWTADLPTPDETNIAILRGIANGQIKELPQGWSQQSPEAIVASFVAVEYGNTVFLRHMLQAGLSTETTWDGSTLLCSAIIANQISVVELLLDAGAQVDVFGEDNLSPLMQAAAMGNVECIKLLQAKGAKSDLKNKYGLDARSYARNKRAAQLFER